MEVWTFFTYIHPHDHPSIPKSFNRISIGCGSGTWGPAGRDETGAGGSGGLPDTIETLDYKLRAEVVTRDLEEPWALGSINTDTALVAEQSGRLRLLIEGVLRPDRAIYVVCNAPDQIVRLSHLADFTTRDSNV